ncbi:MAG: hypothetical protein ISR91_07200 [Candidatus Delongbacteria bacterium]|nr:hypothetical protein [Candidatus Delongbacteria bacterium]
MEENLLVKQLSMPLYQSRGWLKFLGILSILYGVLAAITIIGLLVCWLPIWQGILLLRAGNSIEATQLVGSAEEFTKSLNSLRTYFTIMGVLALGGLVFTGLALLITGGTFLAAVTGFF